jgi:hypothetical protein
MLYETTKMAKFCRVLLGPQLSISQEDQDLSLRPTMRQESVVNAYRDMLNSFFKLIAKLN